MSWAEAIERRIEQGDAPDPEVVSTVVEHERARLGDRGVATVRAALAADVLGLGPLEALVADRATTDVLVNGDGSVWVDRGAGVERVPGPVFEDSAGVRRLAVRLAGHAGRRLDESQPWVDGVLPSGIRLHAVLPPVADGGTHVSLRVPRRGLADLAALLEAGMLSPSLVDLLRAMVGRRLSFVVTGGTGTGKTTLLGAMLAEVSPAERLLLIEDVAELHVDHPHVVRLQSRSPNVEGVGAVTMVELVRQALRMRPDRVVVGEVRGGEVRELLAALNTGHDGGCGTLHANRPEDVPARFEALGALAEMSRSAVTSQLVSAVQVVIHLSRRSGVRVLDSVGVLRRSAGAGERAEVVTVLARDDWGEVRRGPGWQAFDALLNGGA